MVTGQFWRMALAAYNCGPGNVNKAIRRAGGKRDFWEIYYYLPRETRGYVPAFIAATYAMNYHREHLLYKLPMEIELYTDTILLGTGGCT
jgi:membrane-bound lytic murein transglycosylase D